MAQSEFLTITLTGRPPVKVRKEDWPVLASASDEDTHGCQQGNQPNKTHTWKLTVRRHDDGRAIVYAVYEYDSRYQGARGITVRGGELLPTGLGESAPPSIVDAINRVAVDMAARVAAEGAEAEGRVFHRIAQECIANLPAEEL
jgi:hypothetical protein